MSVRAHPRIMRRRAQVRERGARTQFRRLLRLLAVVAVGGGLVWFAQSPVFSVAEMSVTGSVESDAERILAGAQVYQGRPLVLIRTGRVEAALEADLWIKSAEVHRRFPNGIDVLIVERIEVATTRVGSSWVTLSDDGAIMRKVPEPIPDLATMLPSLNSGAVGAPGDQVTTDALAAAVEFSAALPPTLRSTAGVYARAGQLWATVADHQVRLGGFADMAAKGVALTALLADGELAPNATIDLIAPFRPAVGAGAPVPEPQPGP